MPGDLIQTPQTRWIQGAYESVQRGNLIALVQVVNNGVAELRYSTLRQPRAAAGYVVPAGKTLYITKLFFSSSVAATTWVILSGTSDVGTDSLAAPTDPLAEDAPGTSNSNATPILTAWAQYQADTLLRITAGRYPAIRNFTSSSTLALMAFGHEE